MEISKADWKLFREKKGEWQETYMERLNREYIEILSSDKEASEKFWALDDRMKEDKKKPGVILELRKSNMVWDLLKLIRDGAITVADLSDFSPELQNEIAGFLQAYRQVFNGIYQEQKTGLEYCALCEKHT